MKGLILLRRIVSACIVLAILLGLLTYHARSVLSESMMDVFPNWEVTYHGVWPQPAGGVVASDVTLVPPEGEEAGTFHFEHLSLDVPFFEFYGSVLHHKRLARFNSINNLDFIFSGGSGDLLVPFTDELTLFGSLSAAPFETEGCASDNVWAHGELQSMGLSPGQVTLELDYQSKPNHYVYTQSLSVPGVSSVSLRRELQQKFSFDGDGDIELTADEWHIKDDGFVAARNSYCANKDGVDVNQFVQRHVRSVKRLLALAGVAPTASMTNAYQSYARSGGNLDVVIHYDPAISGEVYNADTLSAWLPYMHGKFTVNGATQALALVATAVRPWPDDAGELSTFQLLQREAGVAPATQMPRRATAAAINKPAVQSVAMPTPATLASATVTSQPNASAMIATVPVADVVDDDTITHYRQLAEHIGERYTVYRRERPSVYVQILRVDKHGEVWLRRSFRNGDFDFALDRKTFQRAEK
ncbi:MAG: hypothetical protein L0H70_01205 [Xanthomonadales bacterium]|nr:hypothetical protein [Xanthomonadales bacterium]